MLTLNVSSQEKINFLFMKLQCLRFLLLETKRILTHKVSNDAVGVQGTSSLNFSCLILPSILVQQLKNCPDRLCCSGASLIYMFSGNFMSKSSTKIIVTFSVAAPTMIHVSTSSPPACKLHRSFL